jgi:hypothetical protein
MEYQDRIFAATSLCLAPSTVEGNSFVVERFRGSQPAQMSARNIARVDPREAIAVTAQAFGACQKSQKPWVGAVSTALGDEEEHRVFDRLESLASRST